jgi:hypothetical protein
MAEGIDFSSLPYCCSQTHPLEAIFCTFSLPSPSAYLLLPPAFIAGAPQASFPSRFSAG